MLTSGMGMIRSNPDIARVVNEMLTADAHFDRNENRSVHREPLVRNLCLKLRKIDQSINAVSRHISSVGIEIIADREIAIGAIAEIEIERLKGPALCIIAECRWCRHYGGSGKRFILGWQFQSLKR